MNGSSFTNLFVTTVSNTDWVVIGNRDYDGNGPADILWYNTTSGELVFWGMNANNRLSNVQIDFVGTTSNWNVINLN